MRKGGGGRPGSPLTVLSTGVGIGACLQKKPHAVHPRQVGAGVQWRDVVQQRVCLPRVAAPGQQRADHLSIAVRRDGQLQG